MIFSGRGALRPSILLSGHAANRDGIDGDMRTMERMVPDLIALFRSVRNAIRENW
jgi:hypothetical protein